jgi:hypothetical protein
MHSYLGDGLSIERPQQIAEADLTDQEFVPDSGAQHVVIQHDVACGRITKT